jgi:hypothetical protein
MLPSCDFVSFVVVTVKLSDYYVALVGQFPLDHLF